MKDITCNKCGRPMQYATEPKCNYCDSCMNEYCGCKLGRIKEIEPTCDSTAVIPSVTVESVEGITNLANCLVHVNDINTTFYVDDKHRVMITWAGPVDIPGYDMANNPNGYRDQIVTDIEKGIAVIYDKHGKGFTFGIEQSYDITEIINNKLDEMAASGELSQIIDTYLNAGTVHGFDTVADMKASSILGDGSHAKTLGYYAKNDLGEATYKIRSKTVADTPDEMTLIAMQDNTLVAELMLSEEMNVRQFGAKGDGSNDDTANIQKALDTCATVLVPGGTYMIDALTYIRPNSHNKLILDNDATLKAITNSANSYAVLWLENVVGVEISGGTIEGERLTHTGSTGEWGHCIRAVNNCDEIYIHDINLINAWGDGIACKITGSIATERVHVDNARRNGYSIASASRFVSTDDFIENTNGTNPQYGVDIEPDSATQAVPNVIFDNLTTKNNASGGFQIHLTRENTTPSNIYLNNYRSYGDYRGIYLHCGATHTGEITILNPFISDSVSPNGIFINPTGTLFAYRIIRPIVTRYHVVTSTSYGIYCYTSDAGENGNIFIYEPTVINAIGERNTNWAIGFNLGGTATWKNIRVIDPIDLGGKKVRIGNGDNVMFTDKYGITSRDQNSNYTLNGDNLNLLNTSSTYTSNRNITISDTTTPFLGAEISFRNTGDYKMNVLFPSQYIYPLSSTSGKTVTLNDKGDSMTIKRIGSDSWMVINQNGNITTN